jgi:hypothetical protein
MNMIDIFTPEGRADVHKGMMIGTLNRHALWQRLAIGDVDGRAMEIRPVQTQRGFEQFCIGLGTEAPELRLHCRRRAISDQDSQRGHVGSLSLRKCENADDCRGESQCASVPLQ